jgi:hypothetical protein
MKPDSIQVFQDSVETALLRYSKALEKIAIATLKGISRQDPESEFTLVSGMGTWSTGMGTWSTRQGWGAWGFERKGMIHYDDLSSGMGEEEIEPEPAFSAWQDAYSNYPSAIPTLKVYAKAGKIKVDYNW